MNLVLTLEDNTTITTDPSQLAQELLDEIKSVYSPANNGELFFGYDIYKEEHLFALAEAQFEKLAPDTGYSFDELEKLANAIDCEAISILTK